MDWGAVWNTFRYLVVIGLIVIAVLVVFLIIYYIAVGSKKSEQIKVAKRRAKQLLDAGEIPDLRTYEYIRYVFSQATDDPEIIELMAGLDKLRNAGKIKKL